MSRIAIVRRTLARSSRRWPLAAFAIVAATGAAGQPAAIKSAALDPVVVTAARNPQSIADLVADVTVIDADEIARSGAASLAQMLMRQPGVEVVQNGGPGATSGVFVRGANRGQTVVLLDGLRLESSTMGAASLEAIPLDQVERIEILRGPASSLYGADAIGGVIQVFTRRGAAALAANASASYGTHETAAGSAGVSGAAGPVRYAVQAGGRRSDGFTAITNPANFSWNPDRDGYEIASASASASVDWAKDQRAGASYLRSRLDSQFDGGPGFDDRTITVIEAWQVESRNRIASAWQWTISAGRSSDESTSRTGFGEFAFRTRDSQLRWQHDIALAAGDLSVAYERREERLGEAAGFAVTARDTDALIAVYRLAHGAHALQANLRHDDSSQFDARTTGTLAWGWRFAPGWRVTASAGTAFKAPTFNDLYYPGYSNPDLDVETARNVEAGVAWSGTAGGARVEVRATGWHNRVESLIVFQCDASYACAPQNVDRATLKGVMLAADATWPATAVRASLDLQSPEDDATGHLLPRRARAHGAVSVAHRIGAVALSAQVVASSKRYDDAANTRAMAGYAIVNLSADWTVGRGVTLFVRGENVLDRDYELAADYATGGAQVQAGLRWAL